MNDGFNYLKNGCPICSGSRKDCRQSERTGLIHCRSGLTPIGYEYFGNDDDQFGFGMYKVANEPANDQGAAALSLVVRDTQYRALPKFLAPHHRADLVKRGLTEDQVDWIFQQGWIKSWVPNQPASADRRLPGIEPDTGQTLGCQGLAIAGLLNGNITGYQIANDDRSMAKYIWLSSKNNDGAGPHLPGGDLPLAVWQHPTEAPTEVIICEGFLKSLLTAIRFWRLGKTGYLIIGAAGGNFGASAQTLKALLAQHKINSVLLAPDAGAVANPHIMKAYDRARSVCQGRAFSVLWWGQDAKGGKDIDELADRDLGQLEIITWEEFEAKVPQDEEAKLKPEKEEKGNQAMKLERLIEGRVTVWQTEDGVPWVDVPICNHSRSMPLKKPQFRAWLAFEFRSTYGRYCGQDAMAQVLLGMEGQAASAAKHAIYHRVAQIKGKVYVDLGRDDYQIVEICRAGWRLIQEGCPAKFWRPATMKAMPLPSGTVASWEGLRKIINLSEEEWVLKLVWLSWSLFPDNPKPLLIYNGEQGSGKSKASELDKRLLDPAKALLMSAPRKEGDLMAHVRNRRLLVYDNLSHISAEMSDAFCRTATGGGLSARALYTDDEESVFEGVRPIVLNGIGALASRPDLLERSILINLPVIAPENRITEAKWEEAFQECQPEVMACLFNSIAQGLNNSHNVRALNLPRMADFTLWGYAVETSFGFAPGSFERAYAVNRGLVHQAAIDNDAIASTILDLLAASNFTGTASDLLTRMNGLVSQAQQQAPDWIKSPRVLGKHLIRLAPELRRCGVEMRTMRAQGQRLIELKLIPMEDTGPPPDVGIDAPIEAEFEYVPEVLSPIQVGDIVEVAGLSHDEFFKVVAIEAAGIAVIESVGTAKPIRYFSRLDWLDRSDDLDDWLDGSAPPRQIAV